MGLSEHDKRLLKVLASQIRVHNDSDKDPNDYKWYITVDNEKYRVNGKPVLFDTFDEAMDYIFSHKLIKE